MSLEESYLLPSEVQTDCRHPSRVWLQGKRKALLSTPCFMFRHSGPHSLNPTGTDSRACLGSGIGTAAPRQGDGGTEECSRGRSQRQGRRCKWVPRRVLCIRWDPFPRLTSDWDSVPVFLVGIEADGSVSRESPAEDARGPAKRPAACEDQGWGCVTDGGRCLGGTAQGVSLQARRVGAGARGVWTALPQCGPWLLWRKRSMGM